MLVNSHITYILPSIMQYSTIYIISHIYILYSIHQGLVIIVTTKAITERACGTKSMIFTTESKVTMIFRIAISYHYLIICIIIIGCSNAILLQEQLTSCGRVNTQRAYCPNSRHRLPFLISDNWSCAIIVVCILLSLVVERLQGIVNLGHLIRIMTYRSID